MSVSLVLPISTKSYNRERKTGCRKRSKPKDKNEVIKESKQAKHKKLAGTGDEVEAGQELMWNWMKTSVTYRDKFKELIEYGQKHPMEIHEIRGVRVCFKPEFCIGMSSHGTAVYIGLGKDGSEKAVKRIEKSIAGSSGSNEKEILNSTNAMYSKHVVQYWIYDDKLDEKYAFLILELCEENLEQIVTNQTLKNLMSSATKIMSQILKGLRDLHREPNPVLHRNLKPSNIMRNIDGKWLLADFGRSPMLPERETTYEDCRRETKLWKAVESCPPEPSNQSYNVSVRYQKQSDIQVAGMMYFYILTKGKHPFGSENDRVRNLLDGNPVDLRHLKDPVAKDLISWMLQRRPQDRPSAEDALKHPCFLPRDQQFELLKCVSNEPEIRMADSSSNVVKQLNTHNSLSKKGSWKSQIHPGVENIVGQRGYQDDLTDLLRFVRCLFQIWDEQELEEEVQKVVGELPEYVLKLFPTLPVDVHQIIRNQPKWKQRRGLKKFFPTADKDIRTGMCAAASQDCANLTRAEPQNKRQKREEDGNITRRSTSFSRNTKTAAELNKTESTIAMISQDVQADFSQDEQQKKGQRRELDECVTREPSSSRNTQTPVKISKDETGIVSGKPLEMRGKDFPLNGLKVQLEINKSMEGISKAVLRSTFENPIKKALENLFVNDDTNIPEIEDIQHGSIVISLLFSSLETLEKFLEYRTSGILRERLKEELHKNEAFGNGEFTVKIRDEEVVIEMVHELRNESNATDPDTKGYLPGAEWQHQECQDDGHVIEG